MAQVKDLFPLLDALGGRGADTLSGPQKVAMLNAAKSEVWKLLVGTDPQQNWFVGESQSSNGAGIDFFPLLVANTRQYLMPPNFHQLKAVEPVSSDFMQIYFSKQMLDEGAFRKQRTQNTNFTTEVAYDIIGVNPGTMILALSPPQTMEVKLFYSRKPTEWTSETTSVDEFPTETHNMMCDWAAARIQLANNKAKFDSFMREWRNGASRWLMTYRRDNTDVDVVTGFLEGDRTT